MKLKLCNNGKSVVGQREDGATVSYSIEAEEYKQWLLEGNAPEPEFTEAELAQQVLDKSIAEALAYLVKTNHKFYIGYIPKDGEDLVAIQALRDEALLFIRENDVPNT